MPSIKCADIGMKDDPFQVRTATRDELMKHLALHAEIVHGMKEIPPDVINKVNKAIKE